MARSEEHGLLAAVQRLQPQLRAVTVLVTVSLRSRCDEGVTRGSDLLSTTVMRALTCGRFPSGVALVAVYTNETFWSAPVTNSGAYLTH